MPPFWEWTARKNLFGDIFDQTPDEMSRVRGKPADHVGNHVVVYPERAVPVTSPATESSNPPLLHSLNNSNDKRSNVLCSSPLW